MLKAGRKWSIVLSLSLMLLFTTGAAFATTIGPGTLPSWAGEATWTYVNEGYFGTNYSQTINNSLPSDNVNIWFSFVYDRNPYQGGTRFATNINWGDNDYGYTNYISYEEWFNIYGYSTSDSYSAQYGRVTTYVDLYGDLDWESIDFVTYNSQPITEVYVYVDQNPVTSTPEPATMLLLGFGLVGLAGVRRKLRG